MSGVTVVCQAARQELARRLGAVEGGRSRQLRQGAATPGDLRKQISASMVVPSLRGLSDAPTALTLGAVNSVGTSARSHEVAAVPLAGAPEGLAPRTRGASSERSGDATIGEFAGARHIQNVLEKPAVSPRRAARAFDRSLEPRVGIAG